MESAERIGRFVTGQTCQSLLEDEARFDAVLFNLQVIGEAVKKLPAAAHSTFSEHDLSGPARLRDLIAHHYFALDAEVIWEVANFHIPKLLVSARQLREVTEALRKGE